MTKGRDAGRGGDDGGGSCVAARAGGAAGGGVARAAGFAGAAGVVGITGAAGAAGLIVSFGSTDAGSTVTGSTDCAVRSTGIPRALQNSSRFFRLVAMNRCDGSSDAEAIAQARRKNCSASPGLPRILGNDPEVVQRVGKVRMQGPERRFLQSGGLAEKRLRSCEVTGRGGLFCGLDDGFNLRPVRHPPFILTVHRISPSNSYARRLHLQGSVRALVVVPAGSDEPRPKCPAFAMPPSPRPAGRGRESDRTANGERLSSPARATAGT